MEGNEWGTPDLLEVVGVGHKGHNGEHLIDADRFCVPFLVLVLPHYRA